MENIKISLITLIACYSSNSLDIWLNTIILKCIPRLILLFNVASGNLHMWLLYVTIMILLDSTIL